MNRPSLLSLAGQLFRALDGRDRRQLLLVLSMSIAAASFTVVGVASVMPFFAVLGDPSIVERVAALAWLEQVLGVTSRQQFFTVLGIGFVALLCAANFMNFLSLLAIGRFSHKVGAAMHARLFEEFVYRDLQFHKSTNSSYLETQVVQEVQRGVEAVIRNGLIVAGSAFSILLIAAAILIFNPVLSFGVLLVLGAVYVFAYRFVRRKLERNGARMTRYWRDRSKKVSESFDAIRELILLDARGLAVAEVARDSRRIARALASSEAIAASPKFLLECATAVAMVSAALWMFGRSNAGEWLAQLAFLSLASYRLLPALQQLFLGLSRIQTHGRVLAEVFANLSVSSKSQSESNVAVVDQTWHGRPLEEIELDDVSYRHSVERTGGVRHISLRIPAGSVVGLVGPSGSGKTTLVELILGLLVADEGEIRIDGLSLNRDSHTSWHRNVAYVPQRIVMLHGTLRENIAFGIPPESVDNDRLMRSIDQAQLRDLLETLPQGLDTDIGEDGVYLSGGERQRIGIARALYREASLLVLDEATTALDSANEAEILGLVRNLRGSCTTIIISHHDSAVRDCEMLIRLNRGRLAGVEFRAQLADSIDAPMTRWQPGR